MLHYRRVAALVLGAWLAGSVTMAVVMRQYRDVEHVFDSPAPEHREMIRELRADPLRQVLRYHVWEQTRELMYAWGGVQLLIGPGVAWLLLLSMRANRLIVGGVIAMAIIACFNQFIVGPEMTYAGRALDFGGGSGRPRYLILSALYVGVEAAKLGAGLALAWVLLTYRSGRDDSAKRPSEVSRLYKNPQALKRAN